MARLARVVVMDNHVHLIVKPEQKESLALAVGETHKRYTRMVNFREGWRGYLWEGRFKSFILDEQYLYVAVRYVERNPVRARLVKEAEEYLWSSARAHAEGAKTEILSHFYLMDEIKDWKRYLTQEDGQENLSLIRQHAATGRPLGDVGFLEKLAIMMGIDVTVKRAGRKPKK